MNYIEKAKELVEALKVVDENSVERDEILLKDLNKIINVTAKAITPSFNIRTSLRSIIFSLMDCDSKENLFKNIQEILEIVKNARSYSRELEKVPLSLATEESYAFGFKPIDLLIEELIKHLDKIFKESYELFDWMCWENEFGEKNLSCWIEIGGPEYKISSIDDFMTFFQKITDGI